MPDTREASVRAEERPRATDPMARLEEQSMVRRDLESTAGLRSLRQATTRDTSWHYIKLAGMWLFALGAGIGIVTVAVHEFTPCGWMGMEITDRVARFTLTAALAGALLRWGQGTRHPKGGSTPGDG